MADLFDRFVGTAGVITGHTADSGDTWGPSGTANSIDGSGYAYSPAPTTPNYDFVVISSWTPPGTDYAASCVFGADFRYSGVEAGLLLRASGTFGNQQAYGIAISAGSPDVLTVYRLNYTSGNGSANYVIGSNQNLATQIAAGTTLTATVVGTSPPVLTIYQDGAQIYQVSDTGASPITATGSAGLFLTQPSGATSTALINTIWAGATTGPSASLSPSSATVVRGATQAFTGTGALTNESFTWSAGSGSVSPSSGTSTTYTAPGSGSSGPQRRPRRSPRGRSFEASSRRSMAWRICLRLSI